MKNILLLLPLFAASITLCLAEEAKPNLDDPDTLKKILAEAIDDYDLEYGEDENKGLICAPVSLRPLTGWAKMVNREGQLRNLEYYKDGKKDGLQTSWYENGQKYSEINHKEGTKHGLQTYWYENGQKQVEITRKNGKKHGLETWWDEEGNIIQQKRYENGQQVEKIK